MSCPTSQKQILTVVLQNYVKISFNRLYKQPFLLIYTNLFAIFFSKILNKPYLDFKLPNFTYLNSVPLSLQVSFILVKQFLKKFNVNDGFFSFRYFSSSFNRFNLKWTVERHTPISFNISSNLYESLNL